MSFCGSPASLPSLRTGQGPHPVGTAALVRAKRTAGGGLVKDAQSLPGRSVQHQGSQCLLVLVVPSSSRVSHRDVMGGVSRRGASPQWSKSANLLQRNSKLRLRTRSDS